MATLANAISLNKSRANTWINELVRLSNKEKNKFFSSNRLISKYDYEIRQFRELIRASDRLSLTYSTIGSIMSDIKAVGGTIAKSINNRQELVSYGLDNRFSILYQLLDKRIQKREEFLNCINSYNDIVLGFLEFQRDEFYYKLVLDTISTIDEPIVKGRIGTSSTTGKQYINYGTNKFTFINETNIPITCSLHYKVYNESKVELLGTLKPGQLTEFKGARQYYNLLVSQNGDIAAILKTVKAGFTYKIVIHKAKKEFLLISI